MDTGAPRHASAAALFQLGRWLHQAALGLRKLARRLDARIIARKEGANDRRLLDEMTDRELRDIGISRAELCTGVGRFVHHDVSHTTERIGTEGIGY